MKNKKQKLALIPTIITSSLCSLPYASSMEVESSMTKINVPEFRRSINSIPSQCRGDAFANGIMSVSILNENSSLWNKYWLVKPSPTMTIRAADGFLETCSIFFPKLTKEDLVNITLQFKSVIENRVCSDSSVSCNSNSESEAINKAEATASEKIDEMLVQFLEI